MKTKQSYKIMSLIHNNEHINFGIKFSLQSFMSFCVYYFKFSMYYGRRFSLVKSVDYTYQGHSIFYMKIHFNVNRTLTHWVKALMYCIILVKRCINLRINTHSKRSCLTITLELMGSQKKYIVQFFRKVVTYQEFYVHIIK